MVYDDRSGTERARAGTSHGHALQGSRLRGPRPAQEPRVRGRRHHHHRARHRRLHGDLQRRQRRAAAAAAVFRRAAAGDGVGRAARAQRPRLAVLAAGPPRPATAIDRRLRGHRRLHSVPAACRSPRRAASPSRFASAAPRRTSSACSARASCSVATSCDDDGTPQPQPPDQAGAGAAVRRSSSDPQPRALAAALRRRPVDRRQGRRARRRPGAHRRRARAGFRAAVPAAREHRTRAGHVDGGAHQLRDREPQQRRVPGDRTAEAWRQRGAGADARSIASRPTCASISRSSRRRACTSTSSRCSTIWSATSGRRSSR